MDNKNGIPTLDKWDSQILYLSKCHFDERLLNLGKTRMDALKALWSDRCGLDLKYVRLGTTLSHMIGMLSDLNLLNEIEVTRLLSDALDYHAGKWPRYSDEDKPPMLESLINSVLSILGNIQVRENIGTFETPKYDNLIIVEDKEDSFLDIYEDEEEYGE